MRRPVGNTPRPTVHPQVVIDPGISRQIGFQLQVDQMNKGVAAHRNDLTLLLGERVLNELVRRTISTSMA
ncbi:hypothetical protein ALQ33_200091 [Pseudomonas syringae pv. philadelphi]|uniref:Uncharacterized protein n=1 Tax=Pseudomonas syringae pv. philadelphi TaxID=251706 RepID=A0A3M3ZVK0_9PSED|nr:hypothetical protein ALQ33_200091 [Pseudomonas syringae pv. philadelphi]